MKLEIKVGDIFQVLPSIESDSIDLAITSPPYWGLRDYGDPGQLGNEKTVEEYLVKMLVWVKEIHRVLKPSGNFVLNIGDCFLGSGSHDRSDRKTGMHRGHSAPDLAYLKRNGGTDWKANATPYAALHATGESFYKERQFLSVSSLAYEAILKNTPFICRGEHIWCKPNVPSPIRSRLKQSHEKLFVFVKDADKNYFEPAPWMQKIAAKSVIRAKHPVNFMPGGEGKESKRVLSKAQAAKPYKDYTIAHSWRVVPVGERQRGEFALLDKKLQEHIAPFPAALIRPYVLSYCPPAGTVLDPFMGSGTTMHVAKEQGRNCLGIEISEKWARYAAARCGLKNMKAEYPSLLGEAPHTSANVE